MRLSPSLLRWDAQRVYRSARTPVNEKILTATATNSRIEIPNDFIAVRWLAEDDRETNTSAWSRGQRDDQSGQPTKYGRLGDFIYFYPAAHLIL